MLALGGRGGRRIPNSVLVVLLGRIGEGLPLTKAVAASRLHTEGDRQVILEPAWPDGERKALNEIGYVLKPGPGAVVHAVERDPRTGDLVVAGR